MELDKKIVFIIAVVVATIVLLFITDRGERYEGEGEEVLAPEELAEGRRLSRVYCSGCHTYPEPGLLPKNTWVNETLPRIGPMLGIRSHNGVAYDVTETPHQPESFFPSEQLLSNGEWQKILDYYEQEAPQAFPPAGHDPEVAIDSLSFSARVPDSAPERAPLVTASAFDPGNRLIYLADANRNRFMVFDQELELKDEFSIPSPVSDIQLLNESGETGRRDLLLTYIGHMNPSDAPLGSVVKGWYDPVSGEADIQSNVLRASLIRPVESRMADLNGDGIDDLLTAEFGHRTGKLSWLEGADRDSEPHTLIETPGCIETHLLDVTGNGLPDIMALCTQVDQSVYLFHNRGEEAFKRKRLLQFDITAGSTSFKLVDFNGDGHPDILYTSGDNADYSQIFKPYHGVYIYLNDGDFNFAEEWFYPVNGAYDAVPADFNEDGRPDIAVISYFADYSLRPEEGFLLFMNESETVRDLAFTPYHPPAASAGRWLTMDVADWTGDGHEDFLLANFSIGPDISDTPFRRNWSDGPYFMVLEGQREKAKGKSER